MQIPLFEGSDLSLLGSQITLTLAMFKDLENDGNSHPDSDQKSAFPGEDICCDVPARFDRDIIAPHRED